MNRIFYLLFIAAVFLISCSGLDETSSLGGSIVKKKTPDGLQPGVYNTIEVTPLSFGSVVHDDGDTVSGMHIFRDSLQNGGEINPHWAVGNWNNESTALKLSHFKDATDTVSIKEYLLTLLDPDSILIIDTTIKAELVWTNIAGNNSFDNASVEVGAIFNNKSFFPLNFASVNSKDQVSSVPITLETYLLNENNDSTKITRFDVKSEFFVDTFLIDSVFSTGEKDTTAKLLSEKPTVQNFKSDTTVSWKHFILPAFYDTVIVDTVLKTDFELSENIKLLSKKVSNQRDTLGRITHKRIIRPNIDAANPEMIDTTFDTLGIVLDTSMTLRIGSKFDETKRTDSVFVNSPKDKKHVVTQRGLQYKVPLNDPKKGMRAIGGNGISDPKIDMENLSDTLSMYLRIDKDASSASILHLSEPALVVSYRRESGKEKDTTTTLVERTIYFTKSSIIAKSSDVLTNEMPVISGALERFAEINLDLSDFFDVIKQEQFLSVGLANLTLSLAGSTGFPAQYGDSIRVNAIMSSKKLTPKTLYELNGARQINTFWVNRSSTSAIIPLAETITDFVYNHSLFEKTAPPNAYLYMWLDSGVMGRIYFEPGNSEFTYILQARKGGE